MTKSKWRQKFKKWLGDWQLAFSGVALATKKPKFCLVAVISFLIFGTLMNLLAGGTASFSLMGVVDFWGKLEIIKDAFLGLFGVGRAFTDWALYFFIALLQGILIGLVALVWKKRKDKYVETTSTKVTKTISSAKPQAAQTTQDTSSNSENLQHAGLAAGLAVLGSGCPTCGTTLLAPLIGAISSSGGLALAGAISGALTVASVLIALYALKKVGKEAYIELINESYNKKGVHVQ